MSTPTLSAARTVCRLAVSRRATRSLSTEPVALSSSEEPIPSLPRRPTQRSEPNSSGGSNPERTAYVRSWDTINNMQELFGMLRAVERRFGRVRAFRVNRDGDISTKYSSFFMVDFEDPNAISRVPTKGENIKAEIPTSKTWPGDVRLADIAHLLAPREQDWEQPLDMPFNGPITVLPPDSGEPTRTVELIVQRANNQGKLRERQPQQRHVAFGAAFYAWGGFYTPKEGDERPVSPGMERSLEKWRDVAEQYLRRQGESAQRQSGARNAEDSIADEVMSSLAEKKVTAREAIDRAMAFAAAASSRPIVRPEVSAQPKIRQAEVVAAVKHEPGKFFSRRKANVVETGAPNATSISDHRSAESTAESTFVPPQSGSSKAEQRAAASAAARKARALHLARMYVRKSLVDSQAAEANTVESKSAAAAEEHKAKETEGSDVTIRSRLLKFMGGWR